MKLLLLADARAVHTERYKAALEGSGIKVILASMESTGTEDILIECPTGIRGVDYRLAAGKIKAIVESEKPEIVDAHSASGYGYAAAVAGISKSCPLVIHCLGSDILISAKKGIFHKRRIRTALAGADMVFVDSEFIRNEAAAIEADADYKVIYWGAEESIFRLFRANHEVSITDHTLPAKALIPRPHEKVYNNGFIVNSLADHVNRKQIELLFPDWGNETGEFRKYAERLCPSGGINYYARMPRSDYIGFLGSFTFYISASHSDSSPASLIEAMAAGLIPLVGNIPGVVELMKRSTELLYDINEPGSLRKLFESIRQGQLNPDAVRQANYDMIRKTGRFEDNIDSTIQVMQNLISNES